MYRNAPLPDLDTALVRFSFVYNGVRVPCDPAGDPVKLTLTPEGDTPEKGQFYTRTKLAPALQFTGDDYAFLWQLNRSPGRCTPLGFLIETRAHQYTNLWELQHQSRFTCNNCTFDPDKGTATVEPATDDAYRALLENYEQEFNLLPPESGPYAVPRQDVLAQLQVLAAGIQIEFGHIGADVQADYAGKDGWAVFWYDDAVVSGTPNDALVIFRYIRRQVSQLEYNGTYYWPDYSQSGFERVLESSTEFQNPAGDPPPPQPWKADYVKTPDIQSFTPPRLTGQGVNTPFRVNGIYTYDSAGRGGPGIPGAIERFYLLPGTPSLSNVGDNAQSFLACEFGQGPADYGLDPNEWVKVTGPNSIPYGAEAGGANSSPDCTGTLNIRVAAGDVQCREVYWRFGSFVFDRCFPVVDAVHWLLRQTGTPPLDPTNPTYTLPVQPAVQALLPPTATQLSDFFTVPANQATDETGAANELPRVLVCAGSDVKRFNASEAASRVMVSLKVFLADLAAAYDIGWFIDPDTGWLRLEHRAWRYGKQQNGAQLDLTTIEDAALPRQHSFRTESLPRFEEVKVANALTYTPDAALNYATAFFDYGDTPCASPSPGSNRSTRTLSRLTGDVPALVLSGASLPDNCIALLAPDANGRLPDANAKCSASELLRRYHRYGMVAEEGLLVPGNVPVAAAVLRPQIAQPGQSVQLASLTDLQEVTRYQSLLGSGALLDKAEWNVRTRLLSIDLTHPLPAPDMDAPTITDRQYDDSYDGSYR